MIINLQTHSFIIKLLRAQRFGLKQVVRVSENALRTDGRMDTPSFRDATAHLKKGEWIFTICKSNVSTMSTRQKLPPWHLCKPIFLPHNDILISKWRRSSPASRGEEGRLSAHHSLDTLPTGGRGSITCTRHGSWGSVAK